MTHSAEQIRLAARVPYGPIAEAPDPQQIGDAALFVDPEGGPTIYQVQSGNWVPIARLGAPSLGALVLQGYGP